MGYGYGLPILVTGATGLVGSKLVACLLGAGKPVYACLRDEKKARALLGEHPLLTMLTGDVRQPLHLPGPVGAIVHGANPTASSSFVEDPCGTIDVCLDGTRQLLELARAQQVTKFIYLSSGEVYGCPSAQLPVRENQLFGFDPLTTRSSYPEAKRMCETMCAAYHAQFGVPAVVARLGVVFGPLTDKKDNRLLAQFARCVKQGVDIVLKTPGKTVRSYCAAEDAAQAIICLLDRGEPGTAYNIANPELTMSVREIAQRIATRYPKTAVRIEEQGRAGIDGYLPELRLPLDVSRLLALGWVPGVGFDEGFEQMITSLEASA